MFCTAQYNQFMEWQEHSDTSAADSYREIMFDLGDSSLECSCHIN
jgi:hypothetical protein